MILTCSQVEIHWLGSNIKSESIKIIITVQKRSGKHCPSYGANVQLLTLYSKARSWPSPFMLFKPLPSPNITSLPAFIPSQETLQDGCLASPSPDADRKAQRWHRPRHRACDYRNCRSSYWCKRLQGRERTADHRNSSHCPLL